MDAKRLAELQELDRKYHLHPFTDHADVQAHGTRVIESAAGCWVTDATGKRLLDGLAGLWCVNVGYGRAEIIQAIREQTERIAYYPSFFGVTTEPTIRLAARLVELAPAPLTRVTFANSGSEANETALKLIREYWKLRRKPEKRIVLSRTFGYHGVGLGSTSLTGLPNCTQPFDLPLPGFRHVPAPHAYEASGEVTPEVYSDWCLAETERAIVEEGAERVAAMFVEPIQGAGGVIVPPAGYLGKLRELCRKHDVLFVADEVITGFGRIGDWFASTLWQLEPDMLTLAKGVTSGYVPLAATLMSDEIADVIVHGGYFAHGFTYSGHPVAAAAALANLDILASERLPERVRDEIGAYFQNRLQALASHPAVGEARGYGLVGALDLVPRGGRSARTTPPTLGMKAVGLAREEGVIVRGIRDAIALSPPLVITREEIDFLFAGVERALSRLWD